ncbi:hypothetical protein KCU61_g799, partial [Aureobasidium melanogenum]
MFCCKNFTKDSQNNRIITWGSTKIGEEVVSTSRLGLIRIDRNAVEEPITSLKGFRVVLNIFSAGGHASLSSTTIGFPCIAGPVSTKVSVDDELKVLEVRIKVATIARENSLRFGVAREEVDADAGSRPEHGVNTTFLSVEGIACGGVHTTLIANCEGVMRVPEKSRDH